MSYHKPGFKDRTKSCSGLPVHSDFNTRAPYEHCHHYDHMKPHQLTSCAVLYCTPAALSHKATMMKPSPAINDR